MTENYAPDEFDLVERSSGRRGAHRARPSRAAAVVPVALVVLLVVGVVFGVSTLLGSRPPDSAITAAGDGSTQVPQSPSASGTQSPTTAPTPTGATSSASETSAPATTSPSSSSPASVDRDAAVTVLNGTRTSGLAARASSDLDDEGWDVVKTDNYRGPGVPTTVFYASEELEATAQAVAQDLGGAEVELDADLADEVTVVLGDDFAGA